ncbi:PIN domain nuclease [Ningiella sp. W23]|uniref:type II toxin-antitoxin system VapC family toxin n=1 Tax=Ningiella sp. W23 TaxID=3023715 RepID=UPI003756A19D
MILVDTSVWIDYLNGTVNQQSNLLDDLLIDGKVIIGDLILLEILQGIKSDKQFIQVQSQLALLEQYSLFGPEQVVKCADNYRTLRKKGVTIRKTNDVIIASFCIEHEIPLLHADRGFLPFAVHLGLITIA